jgi:hypothetical protein
VAGLAGHLRNSPLPTERCEEFEVVQGRTLPIMSVMSRIGNTLMGSIWFCPMEASLLSISQAGCWNPCGCSWRRHSRAFHRKGVGALVDVVGHEVRAVTAGGSHVRRQEEVLEPGDSEGAVPCNTGGELASNCNLPCLACSRRTTYVV